ncbi:MAG TPA: decarboxylating 6-phosphogluconate dehydrogenase [Marinobacter sp.]|nr:decarboxylating 6-phosphogluconate dehydrogenase [Marinobacter sp.]
MQLGMIGLGRMGSNMVQRLMLRGVDCVVYDTHPDAAGPLAEKGAVTTDSLEEFTSKLSKPRVVWLMVPASVVDKVLESLMPLLEPDDIVIDGGNSIYHDDIRRAAELEKKKIHYLDVGTSGGTWGLERGYSLMIGGEADTVKRLDPVFVALAPGVDAAVRTIGCEGKPSSAEQGYLHCGPHGAGHFVKMVHNGIEYSLMAAYAEGLNILHNANAGNKEHDTDAETTPMRHPELYQYDFDLPEIAEVWRRGSVIGSWLLDLTAQALHGNADLTNYAGRVSDSGEGRWTVSAAIDVGVPAPVISAALFARFSSRGNSDFANRILSAMRKGFGGHDEKEEGG